MIDSMNEFEMRDDARRSWELAIATLRARWLAAQEQRPSSSPRGRLQPAELPALLQASAGT